MGIADTHKFESANQILNTTGVRLTFQSWQDLVIPGKQTDVIGEDHIRRSKVVFNILNYFNLIFPGEKKSKVVQYPEIQLVLKPPLLDTPDVFVMNPALAYSLFRQSIPVFFLIFF